MTTLSQLISDYRSGKLPRNDYWQAMQVEHKRLLDYAFLLHQTDIDHLEVHAADLQIALKNGLRFIWRPEDLRSAPTVLINNGSYEVDELLILRRLAQDFPYLLDIGANIGWYSLHLAQVVQSRGGKVYAVEAIPATHQLLCDNLALNPDCADTVQTFNMALGETSGTTTFFLPQLTGHVAASRRAILADEANVAVEVRMTTLDQFMHDEAIPCVNLIKCDVEGSEWLVIQGGMETLQNQRPVIMLEMLRKWSARYDYHPNEIINQLARIGYSCWYESEGYFQQLPVMDDATTATNFFFLHEEAHASVQSQWAAGVLLDNWVR